MTLTVEELVGIAPVIPIVTVHDAEDAVAIARALVAGGLPTIEVTLRTPAGLRAIERIAEDVPDAVVGAGTVISEANARAAAAAGARFLVSPGTTPRLLDTLQASGLPFLPGAATASDLVALLERGIAVAKFFPAESAGGVDALRAFAGPFPDLRFCPTGGIDAGRVSAYLRLANVACVGGSWMVPPTAVAAGDWDAIERVAAQTAAGLAHA